MDAELQATFIKLWNRYFPGAELPITFYYSDDPSGVDQAPPSEKHRCIICDLAKVRHGTPLCFDKAGAVCHGAKRYLGFSQELMPNFSYFLSCGIPGKLEGERYKKTPQLVEELLKSVPEIKAPAPYIVFKRWDQLTADDEPEVVVFFGSPDVVSGVFTLCGFDTADHLAVIAPFSAGCGSIVHYPYLEVGSKSPHAVLGMFDVSARPCVPENVLTIAMPVRKLAQMVGDMEESFLITESWDKVRERIAD